MTGVSPLIRHGRPEGEASLLTGSRNRPNRLMLAMGAALAQCRHDGRADAMCRGIEIELRLALGDPARPPALEPVDHLLL